MQESISSLNKRISKIEEAIEKLTVISNDLSKVVAVQEQRLVQQDKDVSAIFNSLEKRREEIDSKIREVHKNIRDQEKAISDEIIKFRAEMKDQYKSINDKMSQLEKFNWMTIGGAVVLSWIATYLAKLIKLI